MLASLRDTPSGNRDLAEALKNQCDALALRTGARVSCEMEALPDEGTLPPGTHEALFRVAQEALANVAKHARATRVALRLEVDAEHVRLEVVDNGLGLDEAATPSHGTGIAGMKARAAELQGTVTLADTPGGGTLLTLAVPVTLIVTGDAVEYRRRMVWSGLGLLALTGMLTQRANTGGLAGAAPYLPMVLLLTIMLVRAWVAWRRSRGICA
jgi:signal transduction histidine kinase